LEQRSLRSGVLPQFSHLVDTSDCGLFLFSLIPAFSFVSLFLLSRLFFLALRKR
jgi:hypothetical protein